MPRPGRSPGAARTARSTDLSVLSVPFIRSSPSVFSARSLPAHSSRRRLRSLPSGVTMSVSAIVMMSVAILTVWVGLVAAIVNIARHPEAKDD